ncbi:hypothetical protein K458DRAFT_429292 [Lentithecium fluviatile CBS 122367]|uniref:Rhodopsin domain-containing protein n=1 Tax=Lentithecium fluviatile CBS 122367 TaxID=1168545 RepID=A0A6G1J9W3_9PLEO|nr:hypothetical protein K458DRAFT_429292 [Lentithecium fluviatile CBS 122367]
MFRIAIHGDLQEYWYLRWLAAAMSPDLSTMTPEQLANMPGMPPPSGVKSNFVNPETQAPQCIAIVSIFLGIMIITLAMRLYTRIYVVKRTGWDDWTALLAGVSGASVTGVVIATLCMGVFGPHTWDVPVMKFMSAGYNAYMLVLAVLAPFTNFLTKFSALLLLQYIFPSAAHPRITLAIYFGLGVNILFHTIAIIYTLAVCTPQRGSGGLLPQNCSIKVRMRIGIATAVVNAVLDLYLLVIALPTLWQLKLPLRKKLGVVTVLATGIIVCVCSIVSAYLRVAVDPEDDPARKALPNLVVSTVEPLLAVIVICLPSLPALWQATLGKKVSGRTLTDIKGGYELHSREFER